VVDWASVCSAAASLEVVSSVATSSVVVSSEVSVDSPPSVAVV